MIAKTTITASEALMKRVSEHCNQTGETLTNFYNRAIINQLENDGDFEVRDIVEEDTENAET